MRNRMRTAAIAVLLATGAMAAPSTYADTRPLDSQAAAEWRQTECRYQGLSPVRWAQREVVATIRCAVEHWPVPGGTETALRIARCESGLRANASNGGRYLGVYQHAAPYWPARRANLNPARWDKPLALSAFNARANVVVAIRMAHASGWGAWSCA